MPHSHITWIYTWITELLTELKALHRARSSKLGSVFQHPPYKNIKIFVMSSSNLLIIQSNPVNTGVRRRPGVRFSKVPMINGPGKLSPFTLKIEVSIVLHLT